VRFPGHAEYDETDHARLIARAFGTTHTELEADQASPELLPVLARQFDEPIADSSMLPTYLVSRLVRNHCTVALGGDGGDELFGGYPQYRRLLWLYGRTKRIPRALREFVGEVGVRLTSERLRGRNWLAALGTDFDCEVPPVDALFDPVWRNRLLPGRSDWRQTDRARRERVPISPDLLDRMTRMDFQNFLAEDILVKVDRASMLASLEVRAPFLDHRIIEFAFAEIPSSLKATSGALKVLLKALSRRVLPPEFDYTRKQGFSIPLDKWLRGGEWADSFRAVLDCEDGWFSRPAVRRLLDEQERGVRHGEQLYALLMVELWRRQYGIDLG
jgi:asparagine synthase (glutamine-hydrolysing)